ncbi:hypothetical protein E3A20_16420 [Planctomyces bekefii]|uniref:Uncharacterized protein n=1 Tax=Planctomyces bekefii TaxID=1653850 RepID=A0A5C6M4K9_9PLAN|nr:hypothetical protein E3A20_16420 [Planctomyces bekefii]
MDAGRQSPRQNADGGGDVVVIHELGHIATKSTEEFVFPFGRQVIRFSFPVIRKHYNSYMGQTGLTDTKNGGFYPADNVQNMDEIARTTLEDRRGRLLAKESARLLAKGQLTEQAYQNFGPLGGLAANIYSAVTETADTRSWTLLPEAYFVTRTHFAPGSHTVKSSTGGRIGKITTIQVDKGKLLLLRDS